MQGYIARTRRPFGSRRLWGSPDPDMGGLLVFLFVLNLFSGICCVCVAAVQHWFCLGGLDSAGYGYTEWIGGLLGCIDGQGEGPEAVVRA